MNSNLGRKLEKSVKDIANSRKEFIITLAQEEMKPYYDAKFSEYKKKVSIKGFRPGRVPINMIKKMYGPAVEYEAEQDAVNEIFTKAVQEDKITVLGQPELKDIKKEDDNVIFTIEFDTIQTVQLNDYQNIELLEPVHEVSDEEIETELDKLREQHASFDPSEEITDEYHVVGVNATELDPDTNEPIEGLEPQDMHLYLKDERMVPELTQELLGKKEGEEFEFKTPEGAEGALPKNLKIKVNDIQKLIPAETNEEFVKKVTQDKFTTVEELKEEIGFNLQEQWDKRATQEMENQIVNKLVELHPDVPLPESVVEQASKDLFEDMKKRFGQQANAQDLKFDAMKDSLRPLAERNVKWELIRNAIVEKEDIKVEDYDIAPFAEQEAQRTNSDKETIAKQLLQNQGFMASLLSKKVMDLLMDFATTEEVSFDEYQQKMQEQMGGGLGLDIDEYEPDHDHDHDHDDDFEFDEDDEEIEDDENEDEKK